MSRGRNSANGHQWSKFWWQDWRADPALQLCSLAARGLWMELLCLMHEAGGYLLVNNSRPTHEQLTTICHVLRQRQVASLLRELEDNGVYSRTNDGTIYCRRMVNDFNASAAGREHGKKGGNPNLRRSQGNGGVNPSPYPQGLTPTLNPQEAEARSREESPPSPPPADAARGAAAGEAKINPRAEGTNPRARADAMGLGKREQFRNGAFAVILDDERKRRAAIVSGEVCYDGN